MITDPIILSIAIFGVLFLGLAKGGFSGIGMVATPMLALVLPPLQAAAIYLPLLLVQDAISVWVYRRDWSVWNMKVLTVGAVIGVGLAWALAAYVSDDVVRLAVGLIGVAFVLNVWFGQLPAPGRKATVAGGIFWGAGSGFTSTLIQAGAPPFQVHVLPQQLPKMTLVGTAAIFFAAVNAMKVAPYFALGQFSPENLRTSAALLPLAIITNFVGIWLVRVTPQALFYRIAYVMMMAISLALVWQGGGGLLSQPSSPA